MVRVQRNSNKKNELENRKIKNHPPSPLINTKYSERDSDLDLAKLSVCTIP